MAWDALYRIALSIQLFLAGVGVTRIITYHHSVTRKSPSNGVKRAKIYLFI